MITVEYGKENSRVILLLHGGGLSWWNYREAAELLQQEFHVVIPILDGHAGSDGDFVDMESCAKELIEYIDEVHGGSVVLIAGVSLGGQILTEMLTQRGDICRCALIESASVIPMGLTQRLVAPMLHMSYWLICRKWFARWQFRALRLKNELFEEYYRDTCRITKQNMIAFLRANAGYQAKPQLKEAKAKAYIYVGQKERPCMLRSARKLNELLNDSALHIMPKRYHGEFSANCAAEYAAAVREIIEITEKG